MAVTTGAKPQTDYSPPSPGEWMPEDEIDLREYILVLAGWWREIVAITLIAGVAGASLVIGQRFVQAPSYQAAAYVAIARTTSSVSFDERFQTDFSQSEVSTNVRSDLYLARRSALVSLVRSGSVAEIAAAELADLLGSDDMTAQQLPSALLNRIEAQIATPSGSRTEADLIQITAEAASPADAARIANTWAEVYVRHVNQLYGQVPGDLLATVAAELSQAQIAYAEAQDALERFVADNQLDRLGRLIGEKREIINSLQTGRQTAIRTIVDEELAARREVIAAYINALSQNQLLLFEKEQEGKRELLTRYLDAEMENRLIAFDQDRTARLAIYERLADAELSGALAVFDQQAAARLGDLGHFYGERQRLERLLVNAQGLEAQIAQGGVAALRTNALALSLLKTQVFADLRAGEESNRAAVQLALDVVPLDDLTTEDLVTDLAALSQVLTARIVALDEEIDTLSLALASGEGYRYLAQLDPSLLAASGPLPAEVGTELTDALFARYEDLYSVGGLAAGSGLIDEETALFRSIQSLYPTLFQTDALAGLTEGIEDENPLALMGADRARQLLQLQGMEDLPAFTAAAEPLNQAIDGLEMEIQTLLAQQEAERSRQNRLLRERDLALSTLETLENKNAELRLSATGGNSEVRLASAAIAPSRAVEQLSLLTTTALASVVGGMVAIFLVFLANFMGAQPLWAKRRVV